jgi:hypothetical protein
MKIISPFIRNGGPEVPENGLTTIGQWTGLIVFSPDGSRVKNAHPAQESNR